MLGIDVTMQKCPPTPHLD